MSSDSNGHSTYCNALNFIWVGKDSFISPFNYPGF